MKKDKFIKGFKLYNLIVSNFWLLLTTVLAGFGIGYLLNKAFPSEKNTWLLVTLIIFFLLGVFNFFYRIIKELMLQNEKDKKEQNV